MLAGLLHTFNPNASSFQSGDFGVKRISKIVQQELKAEEKGGRRGKEVRKEGVIFEYQWTP